MRVIVLDIKGNKLKSTTCSRARRLLHKRLARVVKRNPFIIQLLYEKGRCNMIVKNISGAYLRLGDLKKYPNNPNDNGLMLIPDQIVNLGVMFDEKQLKSSVALTRALEVDKTLLLLKSDDPLEVAEVEHLVKNPQVQEDIELRKQLVEEIEKPLVEKVDEETGEEIITVEGGVNEDLDVKLSKKVKKKNIYDKKYKEVEKKEKMENKILSGKVVV